MRFLADMGVGVRVVEWLRSQGHDAVHLREEGLHRAPDEQVLAKAVAPATYQSASRSPMWRPIAQLIGRIVGPGWDEGRVRRVLEISSPS